MKRQQKNSVIEQWLLQEEKKFKKIAPFFCNDLVCSTNNIANSSSTSADCPAAAMPFHHWVMKIAYDGTDFFGWQKTQNGPSVEQTLQHVIQTITQESSLQLQAASRTDKGVHAQGQIVDFITTKPIFNLKRFIISCNQLLPLSLRVLKIIKAPFATFHPTKTACGKQYRYLVQLGTVASPFSRHYAWHVHDAIDLSLMLQTADLFLGTHDFYGYCNQRANLSYTTTTRTLTKLSIEEEYDEVCVKYIMFTLVGDNFLYKMVRNIVGTIIWVGMKKITLADAHKALTLKMRRSAGVTAPAHGLTLTHVFYPFSLF